MEIKVVGFDPAFANWGSVQAEYSAATGFVDVVDMQLCQTKKNTSRSLYKKVDDFERAKILADFAHKQAQGGSVVFSEMPIGTQSANAAWGLGTAMGVLSGVALTTPVIFVTVNQVKEVVGIKKPTKRDMIEWAHSTYPRANWFKVKRRGEMVLTDKNEHLADALAVIHAGVKGEQFKQMVSVLAGLKVSQH